jgi:hypothetical protein
MTYLLFKSPVSTNELYDFIIKNRILNKSEDISIYTISSVLATVNKDGRNYKAFKKVGYKKYDYDIVWELNKKIVY